MTPQEAQAWKAETAASTAEWRVDQVHDGSFGNDLLAYKGGEAGRYFLIEDKGGAGAILIVGRYAGAVPHIGEAVFTVQGRKDFPTTTAAEQFMATKGGVGGDFFLRLARRRAFGSGNE